MMNLLSSVTRSVAFALHTSSGGEKFRGGGSKLGLLRFLALTMIVLTAGPALAQSSATLAWNASASSGVTGYRVYQGTASGAYSQAVNAGNATQTVISNLTNGTTYYFAVVAVNAAGLESDFSNEINYTPPAGRPTSPVITFAADSGTITAPFTTASGVISQSVQTTLSGSGRAAYSFTIANSGAYMVSALVNAPNGGANSLYVNIDSEPTDPEMIWDIPVTTGFQSRTVTWTTGGPPKIFNLTAGNHQLIIRGREAGAQLSTITISPAGATLQLTRMPGGIMLLGGVSDAGKSYQVQASSDFKTWTTIGAITTDAAGSFSYLDNNAPSFSKRFYRLHETPAGPTLQLTRMPGGIMLLSGVSDAGKSYQIQASSDFKTWTTIDTPATDAAGSFSYLDNNAPSFSKRFYRLHEN